MEIKELKKHISELVESQNHLQFTRAHKAITDAFKNQQKKLLEAEDNHDKLLKDYVKDTNELKERVKKLEEENAKISYIINSKLDKTE